MTDRAFIHMSDTKTKLIEEFQYRIQEYDREIKKMLDMCAQHRQKMDEIQEIINCLMGLPIKQETTKK